MNSKKRSAEESLLNEGFCEDFSTATFDFVCCQNKTIVRLVSHATYEKCAKIQFVRENIGLEPNNLKLGAFNNYKNFHFNVHLSRFFN